MRREPGPHAPVAIGAPPGRRRWVVRPRMTRLDNPVLFLATANAERSRAFYEQVLGLAFVADEPPALVFRIGDSMLRIQKVEQVQAASYTALGWAVSDIRQTVRD